jgi:hypothetical protein
MSLTPEQAAIAAPYIDAAVELFEILKSDRRLAIKLARHHGADPRGLRRANERDRRMAEECLSRIASVSALRCVQVVGAVTYVAHVNERFSFRASLGAPCAEHRRWTAGQCAGLTARGGAPTMATVAA